MLIDVAKRFQWDWWQLCRFPNKFHVISRNFGYVSFLKASTLLGLNCHNSLVFRKDLTVQFWRISSFHGRADIAIVQN